VHDAFESTQLTVQATSGADISLHTEESGDVARSLCGYARDNGYDLLVLGRHGHEGLFHPKLGHIAHAVAKSSPVPVLLVTTPSGFGRGS
jgi:nucleotide-binding universal stress UspA family protein